MNRVKKAYNVLWISGYPGWGKTAIASSLLNSTEFGDVIHAHYFISEDVNDDPRLVWRTITYQLALSSPAYRRILLESGALTTDTKDLDIKNLFKALIKAPLSRLDVPIVVVIDALDEYDYDMHEDFWETVAVWKSLPSSCKLIVASQNDGDDIARELDGTYNIDLESSDESKETMDDIRFLFVDAFEKVEREGWLEDGEIDELIKYAHGSFLWATTVITFVVNGRGGDPRSRFDGILRAFRDNDNDVTLLCAHILMHTHSHLEPDDERENMLLVLAFLTLRKAPLSRRELGELLMCDISIILDNLSPILIIGAPDDVVEFTHLFYKLVIRDLEDSRFPDYVQSFVQHLTPQKQSLRLTHACLRFMKKSLAAQPDEHRKSTGPHCSVNTSRAEEGNPANISNALKYACSYWVDHMDDIWRKPSDYY
ncbi:hypothetical protein SCHPADRAFT_941758 [Schizopora paradoxa]|uniref:Nephrocystin 3-like N-terminal domain-containing protein n=1 Tax=Schizopora paradoxa TaxID=27342 RepID=A0A0H2RJE8_9AGAM|nr:hypothetical protein SCHPADRAFT_941758 [Schizopora paradoxa]